MTTNLGPWPSTLYPPVRAHATANITPFTYYDGLTFLERLEELAKWLRETLIPGLDGIIDIVDGMIQDALENVEIDLEAMRQELADALASIELTDTELRAYVDDAVEQIINSTITITRPVINQVIHETTGVVNTDNYSGSINEKLSAAISDAVYGDTIRVTGQHVITDMVVVPAEKNLTFDFTGAVIESQVDSASPAMFYSVGTFSESVAVSSITDVATTIGDQDVTVAQLQLTVATEWQSGDIVRVVSDDTIPGGHYTSDARRPRMGDYARVMYGNGAAILLGNTLFEQGEYTDSIRVARLEDAGSWQIIGGTFRHPVAWEGSATSGNFFRAEGLVNPRYQNVTIERASGMSFSNKACYGYLVLNCSVDYATDAAGSGVLGYGVHDSSCTGGVVIGGTWRGLRHMFTDGTNTSLALGEGVTLENDNVSDHGRTLFASIQSVQVYDCTSPGIDTHHMSYGVSIADSKIYAGSGTHGIQFRGYGHSVNNVDIHGGVYGVHIFTQGTTSGGTVWAVGDTSKISVNGLRTFGTPYTLFVNLYSHATHPLAGTTDVNKTLYATNVYAYDGSRLVTSTNGDVTIDGGYIRLPAQKAGSVVAPVRTRLTMRDIEYDASGVEAITGTTYMINVDSAAAGGSTVIVDGMTVRASSAYQEGAPIFVYAARYTSEYVEFRNIVFTDVWATAPEFVFSSSLARLFTWRYLPRSGSNASWGSSASATLPAADVTNTNIIRRLTTADDANLTLIINATEDVVTTIATLPAGLREGRTLTIMLGSATGSLVLRSGSEYNTALVGSEDRTLSSAGTLVHLVWIASRWREV